jgi:hypothetical protein
VTKPSYIDWIDAEIDQHQRAIAKLTIAREVIEQARKLMTPEEPKRLPKPQPEKIKRQSPRPSLPRQQILALLAERGPLTSGDITRAFPVFDQKQLWNALYHMRKNGSISRNEKGYYYVASELGSENDQAA